MTFLFNTLTITCTRCKWYDAEKDVCVYHFEKNPAAGFNQDGDCKQYKEENNACADT